MSRPQRTAQNNFKKVVNDPFKSNIPQHWLKPIHNDNKCYK